MNLFVNNAVRNVISTFPHVTCETEALRNLPQ